MKRPVVKKFLIGILILAGALVFAGLWEDMDFPAAEEVQAAAYEDDAEAEGDEDEADEDDAEAEADDEDGVAAPGDRPAASGEASVRGTAASRPAAAAAPALHFVRWRQRDGLFSAEVPRGWRVEGQIDPQGLDKGAFMIQGFAPDGRAMFAFAHNWQWFMEYQYGPYRPGAATIESLIVPQLPANLPQLGLVEVRAAYRGPNKSFELRNPLTGLPLRSDQGTLGLLARTRGGEVLAGTLMGETLYMPTPGSPGLWGVRIFSGGIAPADAGEQAAIRAIQARLVATLELSPEFRQVWAQSHAHTVQRMREYGEDMGRVFERYLASARSSNARPGKDPMEGWAEMMREGHYERDGRTGEDHWVGNNNRYWWKNDRGEIRGNDTGTAPATHDNWYRLGG